MDKNKIVIFIPTSGPNEHIEPFIQELKMRHFNQIVLMAPEEENNRAFFETIRQQEEVEIVHQEAEKSSVETGLETIQADYPKGEATIIADAVGRYSAEDVEIVARALAAAPKELILGVRQYTPKQEPKEDSFFNRTLQRLLDFLEKRTIQETPTSLRALSMEHLKAIVNDPVDALEQSENMLVTAKQLGIPLKPVTIYTESIETEAKSTIDRLIELAHIYQEFIKFTASSLFSTVVDLGLFAIFVFLLRGLFPFAYIMYSTIIARIVSIIVNYTINNKLVFKRKNEKRGSFIRYVSLAIAEMLASGAIVTFIVNYFIPFETLTKILVDSALFFVGYLIQRKFVFTAE